MAEVRLCQGLRIGWWLRRWRRWRAMERRGGRGRRAVLWMNGCAVYSGREVGVVLGGLDLWLGFTSSDICLLVFRQSLDRRLAVSILDVWVTADFMCLQRRQLPLILDNVTAVDGVHLQPHIPVHIPERQNKTTTQL